MCPNAERTPPEGVSTEPEDRLHRIDTVPPPPGEGDAYSAPTRVGPMAKTAIDRMFANAGNAASRASARTSASSQASGIRPTPVLDFDAEASGGRITSLCDEDDEGLEPTVLSSMAPHRSKRAGTDARGAYASSAGAHPVEPATTSSVAPGDDAGDLALPTVLVPLPQVSADLDSNRARYQRQDRIVTAIAAVLVIVVGAVVYSLFS